MCVRWLYVHVGIDCKCSCPSVCPAKARGQFWVPFLTSHVLFIVCVCVCICPSSPFLRLSSARDSGIACLHLPKAGIINVLHCTWLFKCGFWRLNSVPRVCMASEPHPQPPFHFPDTWQSCSFTGWRSWPGRGNGGTLHICPLVATVGTHSLVKLHDVGSVLNSDSCELCVNAEQCSKNQEKGLRNSLTISSFCLLCGDKLSSPLSHVLLKTFCFSCNHEKSYSCVCAAPPETIQEHPHPSIFQIESNRKIEI